MPNPTPVCASPFHRYSSETRRLQDIRRISRVQNVHVRVESRPGVCGVLALRFMAIPLFCPSREGKLPLNMAAGRRVNVASQTVLCIQLTIQGPDHPTAGKVSDDAIGVPAQGKNLRQHGVSRDSQGARTARQEWSTPQGPWSTKLATSSTAPSPIEPRSNGLLVVVKGRHVPAAHHGRQEFSMPAVHLEPIVD